MVKRGDTILVDCKGKGKRKVLGRLMEYEIEAMTVNELKYVKGRMMDIVSIVIEMPISQDNLYRRYGLTVCQLREVITNREEFFKRIDRAIEGRRVKISTIFPKRLVVAELEEHKLGVIGMYRDGVKPVDIFEYYRVFLHSGAWNEFKEKVEADGYMLS